MISAHLLTFFSLSPCRWFRSVVSVPTASSTPASPTAAASAAMSQVVDPGHHVHPRRGAKPVHPCQRVASRFVPSRVRDDGRHWRIDRTTGRGEQRPCHAEAALSSAGQLIVRTVVGLVSWSEVSRCAFPRRGPEGSQHVGGVTI